ncbi:MAG: DNA methyltransferase [Actinomycetota bacterium]|nr:DNA methyltransferase [Actinomycetota bacterium]MDQ3692164.1 DNA methyltransferase [Chloroflexota bacterium]
MTPAPPMTRGSSNEQDAPDATGEEAVQGRLPRSIPKALQVQRVPPSVVRPLMADDHYLRSMPAAARRCYGVFLDGVLVGGVVFTSGARHGHRLLVGGRPQEVATLARLWLSDALPRNSESRVLGVVLRDLRRTTSWRLLLSYADPAAGHVGIIYQATGWRYLGQTPGESYVLLEDGRLHHPRSVSSRFGSNRIGHLRATGVAAARVFVGGKHRYGYLLDPAWQWRLRHPDQPGQPRPRPPPNPSLW